MTEIKRLGPGMTLILSDLDESKELNRTTRGVVTDRDFLTKRSEAVQPEEVEEIKAQLLEAFNNQVRCLGLAAVQIGILKRAAIFLDRKDNVKYLINPVITSRAGKKIAIREGCMSIPTGRFMVQRPDAIVITSDGKAELYSGRTARVIQHEIDHMNGITIFQRYLEFKSNPKNRRRK